MNTQEILNALLVTGLLIITACIVLVTYFLIKTLKSIINITESLQETTDNIKEKLKIRFLAVIPALLVALIGKFLKRGR